MSHLKCLSDENHGGTFCTSQCMHMLRVLPLSLWKSTLTSSGSVMSNPWGWMWLSIALFEPKQPLPVTILYFVLGFFFSLLLSLSLFSVNNFHCSKVSNLKKVSVPGVKGKWIPRDWTLHSVCLLAHFKQTHRLIHRRVFGYCFFSFHPQADFAQLTLCHHSTQVLIILRDNVPARVTTISSEWSKFLSQSNSYRGV